MGALTSRQHAGVEEVDIPSNSVYRYPPKSDFSGTGGYHLLFGLGPDEDFGDLGEVSELEP